MKKVVLLRIDDRLLHGQVVVSWIHFLKVNEVIITDDEYARDEFMCQLIEASAPENIAVQVLTVYDTVSYLMGEDEGSRILILCKNIETVKNLVEKVEIDTINLGGLGAAQGRKRFHNSIHLSDEEINILKDIARKNVNVEVKMLPKDKAVVINGN